MDNNSGKKGRLDKGSSLDNVSTTSTDKTFLPIEILLNIFEHLEKDQLQCSVSRVCTRWWTAVKCLSCWKKVEVLSEDNLEKAIKSLRWHSENLESVITRNRRDNSALLEVINPSKIKCLSMTTSENFSNDSAVVVEKIANNELLFPYLQDLTISITRSQILDVVYNLQKLSLKKLHVIGDSSLLLGDFSDFCFLDLVELEFHQDVIPEAQDIERENKKLQVGLRALRNTFQNLIMSLPHVSDSTIEVISEINQLKELSIYIDPPATTRCLDFIAKLENLICLDIYDYEDCITDGSLIEFVKKPLFRNGLKTFGYYTEGLSYDTTSTIKELCPSNVNFDY